MSVEAKRVFFDAVKDKMVPGYDSMNQEKNSLTCDVEIL
jgi:hypothetical protein